MLKVLIVNIQTKIHQAKLKTRLIGAFFYTEVYERVYEILYASRGR